MSYAVVQLGARMHYAVPRILHDAGQLARLFTDLCVSGDWLRWCEAFPPSLRPDGLRRVCGRVPKNVPAERITAFNLLGLRYAHRRRHARSRRDFARAFLWAGRSFCEKVVKRGLGEATGVYVFNTAGLEVLDAARTSRRRRILEQTIAPLRMEHALMQAERERFPTWLGPLEAGAEFDDLCDREEHEWQLAEKILCGSRFVRDGIDACGGPKERCIVVPYGVDRRFYLPPRPDHDGPLRVLTVGGVGLRKGTPYLLAAADMLRRRATFRLVGALECDSAAVSRLNEVVELAGSVPHAEMLQHFAWADVFLLPSLCEGSATAIYEALSSSLPVICTENCGSIVRDGVDGFVIPIRDSDAIVEAVLRLARDAALRRHMAESAGARAGEFDFASYGRELLAALDADGRGSAP
ncbi:MAG TPA: glycosyltransferase family 4 protein [Dongiaceae bacterium]|nr:glycosyltransferase family 4 protein [Dongiaceae bacterium]